MISILIKGAVSFFPPLLLLVNLVFWHEVGHAFIAYLNFSLYVGGFVSLFVLFPLYRVRSFGASDFGWVILLILSFFLLFPAFWYLKIYRPYTSRI